MKNMQKITNFKQIKTDINNNTIQSLIKSEREIDNGEGIELDNALTRLRQKYGY